MAQEIERKYVVKGDGWRAKVMSSRRLRQFYLSRDGRSSVRVRIEGDSRAWLTIKTASSGATRAEFEYSIPTRDAQEMVALAEGAVIDKVRHIVPHAGYDWEVDVFAGDNDGLIVAEVELDSESEQPELPDWVGNDVTDDRRYYNASLANHPFRDW